MTNIATNQPLCFYCSSPLPFPPGQNLGRSATCDHCLNDVRVCYNCQHYDKSCYNECKEPQAERVLEKNKKNFCDYFKLKAGGNNIEKVDQSKEDVMKKLNDLFK